MVAWEPLEYSASLARLAQTSPQHADADQGEGEELELERGHALKNRVSVFAGATSTEHETVFTLGLEYARQLNELIGIGVVTEWSPEGRELVVAVPTVFFHPVGGLVFSVGPGLAVEDDATHFLVRFGVGYEFELTHNLSLAPTVSYDLIEGRGDAIVYGAALSVWF